MLFGKNYGNFYFFVAIGEFIFKNNSWNFDRIETYRNLALFEMDGL